MRAQISSLKSRLFAALALACALLPTSAAAVDSVTTSPQTGFTRFLFAVQPTAKGTAAINGNVLTIAFDRAVTIDPVKIQSLSSFVTGARIDPDHKTLRIVLAQAAKLHTSTSANNFAVDVAPSTFTGAMPDLPPPPKPPGPVDPTTLAALKVRAGAYKDFTRVVFDWPKTVPYTMSRSKETLTFHFAGLARPDFTPLSHMSAPWVKAGDWHVESNRGIAVTLGIDPGSRTHDFVDGTHVVVDVMSPTADADTYTPPADAGKKAKPVALSAAAPLNDATAAAQGATSAKTQAQVIADTAAKLNNKPAPPEPAKPEAPPPPPANDATAQRTRDGMVLTFNKPYPAAVFMRGLSAWIVIDGAPSLDPEAIKKGLGSGPQSVSISSGNGAAILRVTLKEASNIAVQGGAVLRVLIGSKVENLTAPLDFSRGGDAQHPTLATAMPAATHVVPVQDPDAGDTLLIVPCLPGRAVTQARDNLEFSLLPTASGLAVVPHVDDLQVTVSGARAEIGRPHGLALTPQAAPPAASPAILANIRDGATYLNLGEWQKGPGKDFLSAQRALNLRVAVQDQDAANPARLQLARFYLGNSFAAEALGLIRMIQKADPARAQEPQLLAMRAAAEYMMGRYRDAHNDLSADSFNGDHHAAFWRGMTETALHNYDGARDAFGLADAVAKFYPTAWQVRYRLAEADAALSSGHVESAEAAVSHLPKTLPEELLIDGELIHARLFAQEGRLNEAQLLFAAVEKSRNDFAAAQAIYYGVDAKLSSGAISRDKAILELEKLRFRWRGDDLELATLRKLGQLYFAKQDWRAGMRVLRVAAQNFTDDDDGRKAQDDMRGAFESLFLDGKADKLPPIQSLSLFYDFIELTPIGPSGDDMIRRMSDRLVAVDLLGPAEDLLKYQVTKRLDGIARAQVATRLAMVYLMDKKPEDALSTIATTRITGLPDDINHQRMLVEARALAGLKRWDQALDMVAVDDNPDARQLRADIYWQSGNWAIAGQKAEELLGTRYSDVAPLTAQERNDVMRAAVAYSLANDQASLDRLRTNFQPKMKTSPDASAFNVVTQKIDAQGMAFKDAAAEIASVDTLKTFLADFRKGGT